MLKYLRLDPCSVILLMCLVNGRNSDFPYSNFTGDLNSIANQTVTGLQDMHNRTIPVVFWGGLPICSVVFLVGGVLTNGSVLLCFLLKRSLRTSFNVYLMNLMIVNLIYLIFQIPLDIVTSLYSNVWWLGTGFCSFHLYIMYHFQGIMINSHVLITLTRLWAVCHPLTYKRYHTKRIAVLIITTMWVYVHAFIFPGFFADALYYRLPLEIGGCVLNQLPQPGWGLSSEVVVYNVPVAIMVLAYPLIYYRRQKRNKIFNRESGQESNVRTQQISEQQTGYRDNLPLQTQTQKPSQRRGPRYSRAFAVLTMLTISVLLCWTPANVYYLITIYITVDEPILLEIITVLLQLEIFMDPIYFAIAISDLKGELRSLFLPTKI